MSLFANGDLGNGIGRREGWGEGDWLCILLLWGSLWVLISGDGLEWTCFYVKMERWHWDLIIFKLWYLINIEVVWYISEYGNFEWTSF